MATIIGPMMTVDRDVPRFIRQEYIPMVLPCADEGDIMDRLFVMVGMPIPRPTPMIPTPTLRTARLSEANIAMATAWSANAASRTYWYLGMRRILEYAMDVNT